MASSAKRQANAFGRDDELGGQNKLTLANLGQWPLRAASPPRQDSRQALASNQHSEDDGQDGGHREHAGNRCQRRSIWKRRNEKRTRDRAGAPGGQHRAIDRARVLGPEHVGRERRHGSKAAAVAERDQDRKSTRLNSSHVSES